MSRCTLLVAAAASLFVVTVSDVASAQIVPPPILPSIGAVTKATDPAPLATPANPDAVPAGTDLVSKLARLYAKLRAEYVMRATEGGPKNPAPRDAARDRDATSLGVPSPHLSGVGAALWGAGVGGAGVPLVLKAAKQIPIRLGPMGAVGGGGLAIRGRW